MKNVYTSWNLDFLADKMIEQISSCWKNPFDSPAVIFTDPKTEQWFKLHWLKKSDAGKSVLMNLKTLRIQQFLFDLVTPQTPDFQNAQKLSVELLRDIIITKLTSKTGGKYYFENLGSADVSTYLSTSSDSEINANHLYDFAQSVASLLLDYEDTRPDNLNELLSQESWQQQLYSDIIGENGASVDGIKYLTLYQLVKHNKKLNGGSLFFNWQKERPVFIFGFSGIGQIYRNILQDFSKDFQLEVFLQLADIPEQSENQLLSKWGKFGREQFKLWNNDNTLSSINSESSFTKTDTLLHRLQKTIRQETPFEAELYNADDKSLTLTAAPTRLRETEALHSKICQLLKEKNSGTQLGDILVVAPEIQNYKTAIEQVFDQNDQYAADSDFPYIPYTIADYSGEHSLTAEALSVLFGILKKKYLSRSDLFSLLHNYLVQTIRDISDEEVTNWSDWASQLNIYRDRDGHEDWQKAKNRLLLSRLTKELVNNEILPFESMTTTDSDSLYKFIQIIDELKEWTSYSEKDKFDKSDIDRLEELLKSWLLLSDNIPDNLYNESLVFQNVIEEIERQRITANSEVFADCFANALFDRSHSVTLHSANILTRGVTFANFESNRILSAKYVFFMGLDSKNFPGVDNDNELDLRKRKEPFPGDESIPDRNKNAFLCQLMAAREGLFFSYVNKNLQKDEDFYKASVLSDLFQTLYIPGFDKKGKPKLENEEYEKIIKIDEDRSWNELFTQREFRNKKNFIQLQKNEEVEKQGSTEEPLQASNSTTIPEETAAALPDRITIGQVKRFLQEPFIYWVNQKLTNDYDDEEKEQFEFEPLFLASVVASNIRKAFVQAELKNENVVTAKNVSFDLSIHNELPDGYFGNLAVDTVLSNAKIILDTIKEKCSFAENLIFNDSKNLLIKQLPGITPKDWLISGELAWYNKDYATTKNINTLELSNSANILSGYITSLLLLASQAEEDKSLYSVSLYSVGFDKKTNTAFINSSKEYKASPEYARIVLNKIYNAMFISQFHKCAPVSLIDFDVNQIKSKKAPLNFFQFKSKLLGDYASNEWAYFSKKSLFDLDTDIGYSAKSFDEEWAAAKAHQIELIRFLADGDSEESGE